MRISKWGMKKSKIRYWMEQMLNADFEMGNEKIKNRCWMEQMLNADFGMKKIRCGLQVSG